MNTETALQVLPKETMSVAAPMSANDILGQVALIQEVMSKVMKENEHFGKIPGCGDKPALLKPGAEKLGMTFRLAPRFDETITDLGNGHREYRIKCTLTTIGQDTFVGQGVGSCSTMEGKYRYRTENTRKEVPKEYWDTRDQSLLGGPAYSPRKVDGLWAIFHKVEHDNPADYYNTVHKMAKKRAHVDAILTATAASDIFVQDVEEMVADGLIEPRQDKPAKSKYTRETGISNEDQQKAQAVGDIEKALIRSSLTPQNLMDYAKSQNWECGGTLASLPLPRLHWVLSNFDTIRQRIEYHANRLDENQIPGAEVEQPELTQSAEDVQQEAEQRMGQALKKTQAADGDITGEVTATTKKPTKKAGSFRYGIKVGETWVNTFDKKHFDVAEANKGSLVRAEYKETQYGKDVVSIEAV